MNETKDPSKKRKTVSVTYEDWKYIRQLTADLDSNNIDAISLIIDIFKRQPDGLYLKLDGKTAYTRSNGKITSIAGKINEDFFGVVDDKHFKIAKGEQNENEEK